MQKSIILIQGPTASGKSLLAIKLALFYNSVIISADSRQFYKEMTIGTAVPDEDEIKKVKHYFIQSHSVFSPLTVFQYVKEAEKIIKEEFKKRDILILVGGSGLFIDSLLNGIDDIPSDKNIQIKYNNIFQEKGLEVLLEELRCKDPEYYNIVDKNNHRRIIRALEAIEISKIEYSKLRKRKIVDRKYKLISFTLMPERKFLYNLINNRVDEMIKNGLVEEAKELYKLDNEIVNKTVGYSELFDFFNNEIDFKKSIELIKQNTRRYAKRQFTWFKKSLDTEFLYFLSFVEYEKLYFKIIQKISCIK